MSAVRLCLNSIYSTSDAHGTQPLVSCQPTRPLLLAIVSSSSDVARHCGRWIGNMRAGSCAEMPSVHASFPRSLQIDEKSEDDRLLEKSLVSRSVLKGSLSCLHCSLTKRDSNGGNLGTGGPLLPLLTKDSDSGDSCTG